MTDRLCCYTLLNITQTGVMNRARSQDMNAEDWLDRRNTQSNFDTILQVISLRSQPDVAKIPEKIVMTDREYMMFGSQYKDGDVNHCWKFEFDIHHSSVFSNGAGELGSLYNDCEGVPMIRCKEQHKKCPDFLNTSNELKNIYFEVL